MRTLFLLLILIFSQHIIYAQIQSGEVIYKIRISDDFSEFKDTTDLKDFLKKFYKKRYYNLKKQFRVFDMRCNLTPKKL